MSEEFKLKNLGDYHDLYLQSDTLLLEDVFENFRSKCIEIYKLDSAHFLFALGLAWQACLKKTEVELELLTDIDMLLMFEKGIRGGMCQAIHMLKQIIDIWIIMIKKIESSYLMYVNADNLYGWAMSQKLTVNGFKWVKKYIQIWWEFHNFNLHKDLPFLPEGNKIEKCNKLVCNIYDKENYVVHMRALKQALNHD